MIRLSVSDLESYRYWKDDEDAPLELLLRKLRHEDPPTDQMEAGRAFAKFFEGAHDESTASEATIDGWRFVFDADVSLELPPVRELKAEMVFDTPSGLVTLVGKVDGLDGCIVHDQKLTERLDAERYLDSLQWRAYLLMFEAFAFTYDVFVVGRYKGKTVTVTEYHPMTFYAYPEMRRDVERAVRELAALVARHMPNEVTRLGGRLGEVRS